MTSLTVPCQVLLIFFLVLSYLSSPINVKTSRANSDSYDSPGPESDSDDGVTSSSGSLWEPASPQRKLKAVN
ncbi:hypothetical protein V1523DRAFT_418887 [Lipomyces doorenjongii]